MVTNVYGVTKVGLLVSKLALAWYEAFTPAFKIINTNTVKVTVNILALMLTHCNKPAFKHTVLLNGGFPAV